LLVVNRVVYAGTYHAVYFTVTLHNSCCFQISVLTPTFTAYRRWV